MKTYITEIKAVDPKDGQVKLWPGPEVEAKNIDHARKICQTHGLGYCRIIGVLHEGIYWVKDRKFSTSMVDIFDLENLSQN